DVERVTSQVGGIREGQCVAFSRLDSEGGEIAVVVAEARRSSRALADAVVNAVRAELGLFISEVHFIKRGTLPKTSSGKVQRRECKLRLELGKLDLLSLTDEASTDRLPDSDAAMPPSFCKDTTQGAINGIQ